MRRQLAMHELQTEQAKLVNRSTIGSVLDFLTEGVSLKDGMKFHCVLEEGESGLHTRNRSGRDWIIAVILLLSSLQGHQDSIVG